MSIFLISANVNLILLILLIIMYKLEEMKVNLLEEKWIF